jgi:hypothetical protein
MAEVFADFLQRTAARDNICYIRCGYRDVPAYMLGVADVVYLDANHGYEETLDAIYVAGWMLPDNGIRAGHDYGHEKYTGVKAAVDECFGKEIQIFDDTTWKALV